MATNELGPGVSRYTDGRDKQLALVVFQFNRPPLDSELNLMGLSDLEARAESVRAHYPSGFLLNELNPKADFNTNPNWSNFFFFGRNTPNETRDPSWAIVNGWLVPVTGTRTGEPPLNPNNSDTHNRIDLNPPNASTGGNRAEFVFLEVWLQRIDTDPSAPDVAPGKPQRGFMYRFGNVESGFDNIPDDLIDPDVGFETSERVQVQYRIRVVPDINIIQYPDGFDPTLVLAQGGLENPSVVPFDNMRGPLGDPGLWRAGTGDPTTFGTADGYVYAIPISAVFRRNSAGFNDVGNISGAFNRNSVALSRDDSVTISSDPLLPSAINETDTLLTFASLTGTVLASINAFGEAFFRVDQEIVRVTNISDTGGTFEVTIDRAQLGTIARSHVINKPMFLYTVRPDGLFADQITSTDILDLRHGVSDHFDYSEMLNTNLLSLLKGELRTTWKRFGSSNPSGPVIVGGDRITDSTSFVGGLSRLDAPNGNRRTFSDAVVTERFTVAVRAPTDTTQDPAITQTPLQVPVAPYNIQTLWTASAIGHEGVDGVDPNDPNPIPNRIEASVPYWFNGDEITIQLSDFQVGLPLADADQVRFLTVDEDANAVVAHFEGMSSDPASGGDPVQPATTAVSSTNPDLLIAIVGNRIMKNNEGLAVSIDSSGNLVIRLSSGTEGTSVPGPTPPFVTADPLQEFTDALQGSVDPVFAQEITLHIQFSLVYGAGRGLSHKPDFVHTIQYQGTPTNTSKFMLRPGLNAKNRMVPTYIGESPLVQTGRNRQFARTSEVMIDPGSKSIHIAPYRNIDIANLMVRNGTSSLNWYFNPGITFQGGMPLLSQDGLTTVNSIVDPLTLFRNNGDTRYVEIPFEYVPKPGLHHTPIQATTNNVFPSGINFLMMSQEGTVENTSLFNPHIVSYRADRPGYYITTRDSASGELFGAASGSFTMFADKVSITEVRSADAGPFRGIKFPPFLAPARITGIYERDPVGLPIEPSQTPFDNDRIFVNNPGSDVNLMKDDFDGPTYLLDVNKEGDVFFILNADVIDFSKLTIGSNFDDTQFFVECTLVGMDRGFGQTNGRLMVTVAPGPAAARTADQFINHSDGVIGMIATSPLTLNSNNNEVTAYYSHTPYQGDVFGSQDAFSDDSQHLGPLSVSEASAIRNNFVNEDTSTLPNKAGYEVLASQSFVMTTGTGRLSGSGPLPLLQSQDNPNSVPDFQDTLIDVNRQFSLNRVGYEDWDTPKFPVIESSFAARPPIKIGALSEIYDNDNHPEFAGSTTHLPLGAYFRDKDFIGKTIYQNKVSSGQAAVNLGVLSKVNTSIPTFSAPAGAKTWEGTEFIVGNASASIGAGEEAIITVDGTSNQSDNTRFKTTRGRAGYTASGDHPGGSISIRFPKAKPNADVGSVLTGVAYLVRSQPEQVGGSETHPGHELQMIIATEGVPAYFKETELNHSANGIGEGFSAIDRFRCLGHPLEKRRGVVNTSVNPTRKAIFKPQVTSNDIEFGSGDLPLFRAEQETLPVTVNGQTAFTLSLLPTDTSIVMIFARGVKITFGVDYTVGGPGLNDNDITYIVNLPDNPALVIGDTVEAWYVAR